MPREVAIKNLKASLLRNTDIFHQAIYREEALSAPVIVDNRLEKWHVQILRPRAIVSYSTGDWKKGIRKKSNV